MGKAAMTSTNPNRRRSEAGYTLLLAVFLVAAMIIGAVAAAPSILTEGRREKEADLVWRGEQYERAIGLYYRKFGKYPTKVEDLTKQTNGVRFLRQAYTDPMNKDDGSWCFIHVGANEQLRGGAVMGGNIIGVGSKIKQPSLRVYLGADTYQQWEFIWNPTGQIALPG